VKAFSTSATKPFSGTRRRTASRSLPANGKRSDTASGMSSTELLAKIDALDWDPTTVSPATTVMGDPPPVVPSAPPSRGRWWFVAGAVVLLCAGVVALYPTLSPDQPSRPPVSRAPEIVTAPVAAEVVDDTTRQAQVAEAAAAEERRAAMYAQAMQEGEQKSEQRKVAERQQRKAAREAEKAKRLEQEERERRQAEEVRARAEREAAEARAAKAREVVPAPKGPASPQELCASASNVFARGFCEARACDKPEWRNHPYCLKRVEDQMRAINGGG